MCDANGTTNDHVPPKCIFPKLKDSGGVNYRSNLIKIPSCEAHNLEVSGDDQVFFILIAMHANTN